MRDGIWSANVIEAALDAALWDLDGATAEQLVGAVDRPALASLAVLPGNVLGPALAAAYCAAVAGACLILKAASDERHLAEIVATQFNDLGAPLAGTVQARYWHGGDAQLEGEMFAQVANIIAFGQDATVSDIRRRAPQGVRVIGYGESYSIGLVGPGADVARAARGAAIDVCMFDQRGCMSPQTIYVLGPQGRAVNFAHALKTALWAIDPRLPRARLVAGEAAALADAIRRMSATALDPTNGDETLIIGRRAERPPDFVVGVEPFGEPRCAAFGRVVSVRPARSVADTAGAVKAYGRRLETVGIAGTLAKDELAKLGALRVCELGEMQRPPFGHRPRIEDFLERA